MLVAAGWIGTVVTLSRAEPASLPGVDDRWHLYRSPNFELFSQNGESTSRELLHNLELVRAVFMDRFKFIERVRLEVSVYAFAAAKDFRAYCPESMDRKRALAGFYLAGPDRAVILTAPFRDQDDAQRVIFHEYVHHLFKSADEDPPVWFGEGMAELLAGLRVEGDKLQIGHPLTGRLLNLRREELLSLEMIFSVKHQSPIYQSNDHTGIFYAESWALLHYWYCGQSDLPPDAVERFVRGATFPDRPVGTELHAFFQECFGMDYHAMLRRLERYVQTGSYRYTSQPLPKLDPPRSYAMTAASRDLMRLRLAELAVRVNRSPRGGLELLRGHREHPDDPRLLEVLGADARAHGDESGAVEYWEKAVAAGSTNVAIFRELAFSEGRDWFREFDYDFRLPADAAVRLRARLKRSIEHEPEQSAAYEMLAWVEAFAEKRSIANVNLVQSRFPALRDRARTTVALAMVRVRTGRTDEALHLLQSLEKLQPDAWTAQAGEVVRAKLEGRPVQQLAQTRGGTEVSEDGTLEIRNLTRLPSIPVPDDL